jgi:hypothetical protein
MLVLNTHSYTKLEVELLIHNLNKNFNLSPYLGIINRNGKINYVINIPKKDISKLSKFNFTLYGTFYVI